MSVLDQNLAQFIARPGIRHFHTVEGLILIVVMNEERRNVPPSKLLIQANVGIRKAGTGAFNDEAGDIALEEALQIHGLVIQAILRHRHIDIIPLFLHNGLDTIIHLREKIVSKITEN